MRPCCVPDGVEQGVDRLRLPDVGRVRGGLQAAAGQLGHERVELALVAPDQCDMRAQPREQPADCPPDAAGPARYDDDLVLECVVCKDGRMNRELRVSQAELRR